MINYYELLEISVTASDEVIHAAYKAKVKQYHPDNFADAVEKEKATAMLQKLNAAFEQLTDKTARAKYDRELNMSNEKDGTGRQTASEQSSGRFDNDYEKLLQTKVEGLIVRCKDETDYLNLRDKILGSSETEDIKIDMLRLLDAYTTVKLDKELQDEGELSGYKEEVRNSKNGIIIILVIGFFLTSVFSWSFVIAIVLSIMAYAGGKEDRENLARAEISVKRISIYRMRGFGI